MSARQAPPPLATLSLCTEEAESFCAISLSNFLRERKTSSVALARKEKYMFWLKDSQLPRKAVFRVSRNWPKSQFKTAVYEAHLLWFWTDRKSIATRKWAFQARCRHARNAQETREIRTYNGSMSASLKQNGHVHVFSWIQESQLLMKDDRKILTPRIEQYTQHLKLAPTQRL